MLSPGVAWFRVCLWEWEKRWVENIPENEETKEQNEWVIKCGSMWMLKLLIILSRLGNQE